MRQRLLPAILTVSAMGVAAIALHEGYRQNAYRDPVGIQTIGFGSTQIDGRPVRPGETISAERAVLQLAKDADRFARQIADCIGPVPLYQHEFDAFVSLAYNIGPGAFCGSTIVKRLKQQPPDYVGACQAIRMWTKAGGRELPGLVRRREAEVRLCLEGKLP